jgi:hypothetical protein
MIGVPERLTLDAKRIVHKLPSHAAGGDGDAVVSSPPFPRVRVDPACVPKTRPRPAHGRRGPQRPFGPGHTLRWVRRGFRRPSRSPCRCHATPRPGYPQAGIVPPKTVGPFWGTPGTASRN